MRGHKGSKGSTISLLFCIVFIDEKNELSIFEVKMSRLSNDVRG